MLCCSPRTSGRVLLECCSVEGPSCLHISVPGCLERRNHQLSCTVACINISVCDLNVHFGPMKLDYINFDVIQCFALSERSCATRFNGLSFIIFFLPSHSHHSFSLYSPIYCWFFCLHAGRFMGSPSNGRVSINPFVSGRKLLEKWFGITCPDELKEAVDSGPIMDSTRWPFSAIGRLSHPSGETCTGQYCTLLE